jgi:uncharacterized protein with PIN domain
MKQVKTVFLMAVALFCFTAAHAQSAKTKYKTTAADSVVYQCPMKCEGDKTYDKAGKCPKCNMNLKAISKPIAAVYKCPMNCEGDKTYVKEGKCPVCNMKLSKIETKKQKGHKHN